MIAILENEPLSKHTFYRIGGLADFFVAPKSMDELLQVHHWLAKNPVPFQVLGMGSNVLASDQGFRGLVVKLTKLDQSTEVLSKTEKSVRVRCGASVAISSLLRRASSEGWGQFDLWTGIPGSVGGAIVMNAGTHLGETQQITESFDVFDLSTGQRSVVKASEAGFRYRHCEAVKPNLIVISAIFNSHLEDKSIVASRINQMLTRRKDTQPVDYPSCGSVFKNPKDAGMHAWQVIEKVGLRGFKFGQAQFSEKHCNFIINLGGAKASDVRGLIQEAKARSKLQLGIDLVEEVKYLGDFKS